MLADQNQPATAALVTGSNAEGFAATTFVSASAWPNRSCTVRARGRFVGAQGDGSARTTRRGYSLRTARSGAENGIIITTSSAHFGFEIAAQPVATAGRTRSVGKVQASAYAAERRSIVGAPSIMRSRSARAITVRRPILRGVSSPRWIRR